MKYKIEDFENMSDEDILKNYRESTKSAKKAMLICLGTNKKFATLMSQLTTDELIDMAKLHPYKEVILDTIINELTYQTTPMANYFRVPNFEKDIFNKLVAALQYKNFFTKITEFLTHKPVFPETLAKKIEQTRKLYKIEIKKRLATGIKLEKLETLPLDQPSPESRVEVNNGEMAKIFDKYAKTAREKEYFWINGLETPTVKKLKSKLVTEYISILGKGKEDIAKLIAIKEFENYSGELYYVPYPGTFSAGDYYFNKKRSTSGTIDSRFWKKNILEIEQVENFTVNDYNLGEIFIVKSEFSPTAYALKDQWAPIYEYYKKNKNNGFIRIGSGKFNQKTKAMETTITFNNNNNTSTNIKLNTNKLNQEKTDRTVLKFNSNNYKGKSSKISRKNIEEAIISKSIQKYLGKEKQITDITQVKDLLIISYNKYKIPETQNAYIIAYVENGIEKYELVCLNKNVECQPYPGMNKNIFSTKELYFPTRLSTNKLNIITKKPALETFKSKDGIQYSAYRDDAEKLRIAQIIEDINNENYAVELDTYSVMNSDIEKVKLKSKKAYEQYIDLKKSKEDQLNIQSKKEQNDFLTLE